MWCWLPRCAHAAHWGCIATTNKVFTWAAVSWEQISVTINLCLNHWHGDKRFHTLLPILQAICSSILLNKAYAGYELWWYLLGLGFFLFKGEEWRGGNVKNLMSTASLCRLAVMCSCAFPRYSLYQGNLCSHFGLGLLSLLKETKMRHPKYEMWRKRHHL